MPRLLLLAVFFAFPVLAFAKPITAPSTRPSDIFLTPTALHELHLKLTPKAWDDMQPTRKGLFSGLFAATRPATRPADVETTHESPFGYQYAYVHASLQYGDQFYDDVGLRFKGNSSYMTGKDLKRPFKLELDRYDQDRSLAGLTTINLNNNAMDPTLMREAITYQFFREAGVPASRTASALVYVTVDKLYDHKLAGFYTLVEEIDKSFLKAHFGSAKGLLLKPENAFDLPYQGETFDRYEKIYRPKSKPTPETSQRLIDFVKLIHRADDATFAKQIDTYLDVDAFLRFVAANAMLSNMDSFLSTGHNYYIYIHPDTLKIHFIPWDLNLSFGGFDWVGTMHDQTELSLLQPYVKPNRLIERLLTIDRFAKAYHDESARIAKTCLTPDHFNANITAMEASIAKAERLAKVPHKPIPPDRAPETDLKVFIAKRVKSVELQLAGAAEGYAPYWSKGIFGNFDKRPATKPTIKPNTPTTKPTPLKQK